MTLDSYLGAHKTILHYFFLAMDRVMYVWGGDMDFGFLEFRATHDFGANNVHNSILDPHEVWTPCTISVYHGFVGCIPLTHRICWDSADQWWFSHDQEGLCFDSKSSHTAVTNYLLLPIKNLIQLTVFEPLYQICLYLTTIIWPFCFQLFPSHRLLSA